MKEQLSQEDIRRIFSRGGSTKQHIKPKQLKAKQLRERIGILRTAIRKNGAIDNDIKNVIPYWSIVAPRSELLRDYPHLIVRTKATTDGETMIGLLKVEMDSGRRQPKCVMEKMIELTGHGLVLCPTGDRIFKFIKASRAVAQTEDKTDGIYFGLIEDVLQHGLFGPIFIASDGTVSQFEQPDLSTYTYHILETAC
jgi:hypothetical protein